MLKDNQQLSLFYSFDANQRCLVSPQIGCHAHCTYCYINDITSHYPLSSRRIDRDTLLSNITTDPRYKEGSQGTTISFGCFTECLAPQVLEDTLFLMQYFIGKKNKVSIATKLDPNILVFCLEKHMQYNGQINIFISCPTISKWEKYEKKTANPIARLDSIGNILNAYFNCFLYIKPFLGADTIHDFQIFKKYMIENDICAIVGKRFSASAKGECAPIVHDILHIIEDRKYRPFKNALSKFGKVYERSIEVLI
jgi:DNA repair photolyase